MKFSLFFGPTPSLSQEHFLDVVPCCLFKNSLNYGCFLNENEIFFFLLEDIFLFGSFYFLGQPLWVLKERGDLFLFLGPNQLEPKIRGVSKLDSSNEPENSNQTNELGLDWFR